MTETLAPPVVPAAEERARLKEGVHIERSSRRVRTYFGKKLIADSEHVLLVYETKRPPAYWFPIADVRMEYLEQSQQAEDTIRWRLVVKDRITHNAARAYIKPAGHPHWRATSPFTGIRWTRGSRRMSKSSFILEIPTQGSTPCAARDTCAWRSTESQWAKLADPCSSSRLDFRPVITFRSWTCAWICSSTPSLSRAARIKEWRTTGRLGCATSSSRTLCGVIRRQFPSARRSKTCSASTTSTSTCTSMGCCKLDQSHRSLNVRTRLYCWTSCTRSSMRKCADTGNAHAAITHRLR
jgi:uncharacterized protein (DUF427 family)